MDRAILFVLIGCLSRLLPHPPNFTAMNALALCSCLYLPNKKTAFATLFFTLCASDLAFGPHSTLPFVYAAFSLTVLLGWHFKNWLPWMAALSSLLFFAISNLGVWWNCCERSWIGLTACYLAALPFLPNQVLGDAVYSMGLFAAIYCLEKKKHAHAYP